MPKCPECRKTITHLDATYFVEFKGKFNPKAKPKMYFKERPTGNNYKLRYYCPECETQLFTKHENAAEFLK